MTKCVDQEERTRQLVESFSANQGWYERTCREIHESVALWLKTANIDVVDIGSRVKSIKSFERKLREKPGHEIEDAVGIRVLAHVRSDLPDIEAAIRANLNVDDDSYVNKSHALGSASFGYRSIQFVAEIPSATAFDRVIQEMLNQGPKVEVQIRTVLEHAWAALDHVRYKNANLRTAATDRTFAVTAALLEQADENLDGLQEVLTGGRPVSTTPVGPQLRLSPVRFIETNTLSIEVDKEVTAALDLPTSRIEKYQREVGRAVRIAGWETEEAVAGALKQYRDLVRRAAIACAPVDRYMLIPDSLGYKGVPAEAFPGIALYWLGIVVGFGIKGLDLNETSTIGVDIRRMREWAQVIRHLMANPHEPALLVREKYMKQAAKPYATGAGDFKRITFE